MFELTSLHWIFTSFILLIILTMTMRRDTSLICIIGIFLMGYVATGTLNQAVIGIFNSFVYAINELSGTILIISLIVAMSKALLHAGVNEIMVEPFVRIIRTPGMAYWLIGLFMMIISFFFWPSPAAALMGAVLLPVSRRVGLPAMGVAVAMNLFGHGIALSGDLVIQGAPKLTAAAAGIPVQEVVSASIPLLIVMGVVTVSAAYWLLKRDMALGKLTVENETVVVSDPNEQEDLLIHTSLSAKTKGWIAAMVPILFGLDVAALYAFNLRGSDATALIGGTSIFIMIIISLVAHRNNGIEKTTFYLLEGLKFGITVFGPIIPIAAFFYLGDSGFTSIFGKILPLGSQGLVNDLGLAMAQMVSISPTIGAFTIMIVGIITGLDGSGFSGISLVGSLAKLFSVSIGSGIGTLTALGQIAAVFTGGGTLIPWSVIAAAAICNVSPFELARRNLLPVMIGLFVTTIVAIFLI
ncbi:hypothetical protein [Pelosinus fermentans]|uniref:Transporter n=1 Tax=Pelosinus fermentans JBW45 TaxID=1192197 RepID=I8TT34_9FIRM|nr:hypothetical protein [Pelosinus fermentans]AJQ28960.1 hypothetical protein JBW_03621 [Pelosinus fermentans JBW45]